MDKVRYPVIGQTVSYASVERSTVYFGTVLDIDPTNQYGFRVTVRPYNRHGADIHFYLGSSNRFVAPEGFINFTMFEKLDSKPNRPEKVSKKRQKLREHLSHVLVDYSDLPVSEVRKLTSVIVKAVYEVLAKPRGTK